MPRTWVAVGCAAQLVSCVAWALVGNDLFVVLQAVLFSLLCTAVQLLLALARPGALGMGDVTATLAMGLAVGAMGFVAVVVWWLAMGVLGLAFLAVWNLLDLQPSRRGKVPFVPVIAAAAAVAVAVAAV